MKSLEYPLTYDFIVKRPELLRDIFLKYRPHDGAYIGAIELDGCFLCEDPDWLIESLEIGEELIIRHPDGNDPKTVKPLSVSRSDGTYLGELPFQASILPKLLMTRNLPIFGYLEAKSFKNGILGIAVSIYTINY